MLLKQLKGVPDDVKAEVHDVYEFIEAFLEGSQWICGDSVTLADIQLIATVSSVKILIEIGDKYPNLNRWINNCEKEPWYQANLKGINIAKGLFGKIE